MNWKQKRRLAELEAKNNVIEEEKGTGFEREVASMDEEEQWKASRRRIQWDKLFHSH